MVLGDRSSTGGSSLRGGEGGVAAGGTVVDVETEVDRETGARQEIEAAGYPYLTAVTLGGLGL